MIFFFFFVPLQFLPKNTFCSCFLLSLYFFFLNFEKEKKKKKTYLPLFLTELGYGRQPNQTSNK